MAVAMAVQRTGFDRSEFLGELLRRAKDEEYRWQLAAACKLTPDDSLHALGNGIEAHRSVIAAIVCFTMEPESYAGAVARAINQGGDTDTLAAMAGAVSGAFLGVSAIPSHLLTMLENGPKGRAYIEQLAVRLSEMCAKMPASH